MYLFIHRYKKKNTERVKFIVVGLDPLRNFAVCLRLIDIMWDIISRILQSNAEIFSVGQLVIELTQVCLLVGRGKHLNGNGCRNAELCRKKHGIVETGNRDNLCLQRALVVAESYMKKEQTFTALVNDRIGVQGLRVRDLLLETGISISYEGAGISEIIEFQRHFKDTYNIVVYAYRGRGEVMRRPAVF